MVPFLGYKSIKPASTQAVAIPLVFIRDKQDIFSISINKHQYDKKSSNDTDDRNNSIISHDDWMYSKNISLVNNLVSSFELIWEEKDNYDRIIKEKSTLSF
jgi:hypothetical protein